MGLRSEIIRSRPAAAWVSPGVKRIFLSASSVAGTLRQLLREGDLLDAKTIKSFTVLAAPSGAQGVRRSFTGDGRVVVRVGFIDGSSELVKITLP